MPIISSFYGITISMNWKEHNPPHFHARYNENKARIDLVKDKIGKNDSVNIQVYASNLPKSALSLVVEWANKYKQELTENWKLCQLMQPLKKIPALD